MLFHLISTSVLAAPCPTTISGADLATQFPSMLGQEVRILASVERSLDITTALVVAEGERFAVMLTPEHLWTGTEEHVFAVMGSIEVSLHGATRLPHLILVTEPRCPSKDATPTPSDPG